MEGELELHRSSGKLSGKCEHLQTFVRGQRASHVGKGNPAEGTGKEKAMRWKHAE